MKRIKSRNNSHNSLEAVPTKSGIGAAINEFETKPVEKIAPINARRNESFAVSRLKKSMVMSSNNLYNIHARPSSLAYTLDDHDVLGLGLGLSVSRHGVSALSRSPNPSMYIPTLSSGLRKVCCKPHVFSLLARITNERCGKLTRVCTCAVKIEYIH